MTSTEDKPVDREAWRRLLDADAEGPPELTDARIRAKARQALTPRTGRWWLPASLAASLLLAVVLVQQQYEQPPAPAVVSESDYAAASAESPAPQREEESPGALTPRLEAPAAAAARPDGYRAEAPTTAITAQNTRQRAAEEGTAAARQSEFIPPAPPVVPPPLIDLPAIDDSRALSGEVASAPAADAESANAAPAAEAKREKNLGEIVVTGSRQRQGNVESTTPVTQVTSADVTGRSAANSGALMKSGEAERTPEEWYAEIEKLRAAGKKRAAKRELEKLKEAHPGWLEEHLKQEPPKE